MAKLFYLEIHTLDRDFFEGEIESLVISTPTGELGILYNTLPLITTLVSGSIRIMQKGKWMEAVLSEGFVEVFDKRVTIMSHSAYWPHELNEDLIKRQIDQTSAIIKKHQSYREYKLAKAQLARQFAQLRLKNKSMD